MTLTYDNGEGLIFRRTIAVDDQYLFTIKDEVQNKGTSPVTLFPYGLISRHGTPEVLGYYILHEGLIGVIGDKGLQEETYKKIDDKKNESWDVTNAWLGFTDKYWAAALLPDTDAQRAARASPPPRSARRRPTRPIISREPQTIAPGATGSRRRAAVRRRQGSVGRRHQFRSRPTAATTRRCTSTTSIC